MNPNNQTTNIFGSNILRPDNNVPQKEENPTLELLNSQGTSVSNSSFNFTEEENPTLSLLNQSGMKIETPAPSVEGNPTLDLLNQSGMNANPVVTNETAVAEPTAEEGFSFIPLRNETPVVSTPAIEVSTVTSVPAIEPMNQSAFSVPQPPTEPTLIQPTPQPVEQPVFPTMQQQGNPMISGGMVQQSLDSLFAGVPNDTTQQ